MRSHAPTRFGGRRARTSVPAVALLFTLAFGGCSDLPVQIGRDDPKKRDMKGRVVKLDGENAPAGDVDRVGAGGDAIDPHYEQAVATYRQSYLFWNAEQKQLEESVGGSRVAFDGAYNRILAHLTRMARFLGVEDKEKLEGHVRTYRSMHDLVVSGNQGRLVSRQVAAVGNHIRADFAPGEVGLIAQVPAGPEVPDQWPTPAVAAAGAEGPAAGGAGTAPATNPKAPRTYLSAYADWRAHHKTLVDALFSETPQIDEPYRSAREALERMRADLPAGLRERLELFLGDYERTAKGFLEGVTARKTITQLRVISDEIERNFAPEAVAFP